MPATGPLGLDLVALDKHLRGAGIDRRGELRAELLAGGRSNLTYLVADDASTWVLRRPPLHGLTPSAHDMGREFRVIAALQKTPVPVARTVTMSADDSVLGAPFQMVEFVTGRVVRSRADLDALGDANTVHACVGALVDVLADLHRVNVDAVGLTEFGRPTGYLERQVRRWGSQWDHVRRADDSHDPDVRRLRAALTERIPTGGRAAIVHGDYRIDNTILDVGDPTRVRAVVDWELSTLGDPLSDAALMCVYRDPEFDRILGIQAAWTSPQMPSGDELAQRYSRAADTPLDHWDFYIALACFKLAIIAAGIAYRTRLDPDSEDADQSDAAVAPLIARGLRSLD